MLVEKGAAVLPAAQEVHARRRTRSPGRCACSTRSSTPKEGRIDVIAEVLERHEPGYERDPTKKIQLLTHLARAQARARAAAGGALSRRHGRGRALRGRRDAAASRATRRRARSRCSITSFDQEESLRLRIRDRRRLRRARLAGRRPARRGREGPARHVPDRSARRRRAHQEETRSEGITDSRAETRRHQDRHGHRVRSDRDRPGLRVRLLGDPGRQGAAGRGLPGRAGELEPGDDHDRPGDRRPHLRRAADGRRADQHHRARAPRRDPADAGRTDRAEPGARAAQRPACSTPTASS